MDCLLETATLAEGGTRVRTGPSLTDLNNQMILWEYERAIRRKRYRLADRIIHANPQIDKLRFVIKDLLVGLLL